jgi:predicted cupin superfamily sugar epimerase
METADEIIAHLNLKPHPREGGYFTETYRSSEMVPVSVLGQQYSGERAFGTAIYYLLTPATFSALHRLPGDEIFHFYLGDPVEMLQLHADGAGETVILGANLQERMRPQVLVRGGVWQGSRLLPGGRFALLGTTMAPGFDFADYSPGRRADLIARYPKFADTIRALTRE